MQKRTVHPLTWLFRQCQSHQWMLWLAIVLSLTAAVLALGPYYVVYLIVDHLLAGDGGQHLWWLSMVALALMLGRYVCLLASVYLSHHCAFHIQYHIRRSALDRLAKTTLGFFSQKTSGELKKNLTEDIDRIEVFIAHQLPDLVASVVIPLTTFSLLLVIDARMALIALLPIPLALLCQMALFRDYQSKAEQYHESVEKLNRSVTEFVKAMPVVRLFGIGERSYTQLDRDIQSHQQYIESWTQSAGWPFALFKTVLGSGLVFMVPCGLYFWSQGTLSVSSFLLCILLGVGMLEPLFTLTLLGTYLGQVFEGVARLINIVTLPKLAENVSETPIRNFDIAFRQVDFAYEGQDTPALNQVSVSLPAGSLTALVGPSGAGKSTLAALLAGFWPLKSGEIFIGGQPLSQLSEAQRMDAMALVYQDAFVFTQTVMSNLTMGKDYPMEAVIAAAKAANAHDFICRLPDGYDTVVGQEIRLSGGEKQRLSIARAILKDAPIVVLDEPTSHSDATNQALIQSALNTLIAGKTVLIIAHRLATIQAADQILVMENGAVTDRGTHNQLIERAGWYAEMWQVSQQAQTWSMGQQTQHEEVDCA
ncbi:ABC transporter ATP-binding protein [Vibrio ouci]|uniref:ABC transporter ATP-binding protein n=1 Tax=Vibrio ouci TaxID=2499078 RepID=A0A4Y8WHF6_9VIBR|nr:ABC transporter ATP-binding protein [Vibrio ouci]TFH92035.1 ABC transporter ATP-binding protein [Vibrio ouci]